MKVTVGQVSANPHRDFKRNPLDLDRVDKFKDSIEDNGFWENIVGRVIGNPEYYGLTGKDGAEDVVGIFDKDFNIINVIDGGYPSNFTLCEDSDYEIQIAYGHHRLEALRQLYGEHYEFDLRIQPFTGLQMYHVMITENDDFGGNVSDQIDEAVAEAKNILENDLELAREYGDIDRSTTDVISGNHVVGKNIITRFMQQVKKGEKLKPNSSWQLSKVQRSLARMEMLNEGKMSHEAVRELPSETHAAEFAKAIKKAKVDFTPKEQKEIAKEISNSGMGKRDVKNTIEVKAFEKKYPQHSEEAKKVLGATRKDKVMSFDKWVSNTAFEFDKINNLLKDLDTHKEALKNVSNENILNRTACVLSIQKTQKRSAELLEFLKQ